MQLSTVAANHYRSPRNMGSLDKTDPAVGAGVAENTERGDTLRLQIRVGPENTQIVAARFKAFGCPSVIAAGSFITEWLRGKRLEDTQDLTAEKIALELDLPADKTHASRLAHQAVQEAVANYLEKSK